MKRFWAIALGLLGWTGLVLGDDVTIYKSTFIPTTYYVGDEVELRIQFRTPLAATTVVPKQMPEATWGQIRALTISQLDDMLELRIRFVAYAPGTQTFPSIRLGSVSIDNVSLHVSSVLDEAGRELRPMRGQMPLPGTIGLVVLQLVMLLCVPALIFLGVRVVAPQVRRLVARFRELGPAKRLRKYLQSLETQYAALEPRTLYIQLIEAARIYLAERLGISAVSATTQELAHHLTAYLGDNQAICDGLVALFRHGERVKFGHEVPELADRGDHISLLGRLVDAIELTLSSGRDREGNHGQF